MDYVRFNVDLITCFLILYIENHAALCYVGMTLYIPMKTRQIAYLIDIIFNLVPLALNHRSQFGVQGFDLARINADQFPFRIYQEFVKIPLHRMAGGAIHFLVG